MADDHDDKYAQDGQSPKPGQGDKDRQYQPGQDGQNQRKPGQHQPGQNDQDQSRPGKSQPREHSDQPGDRKA